MRRDIGASGIEYASLVGVATVIVVMLALLVPNPVTPKMQQALCDLFGDDCAPEYTEPVPGFDYEPPTSACIAGSESTTIGGSITVFSIKVGQDFQFMKIKYGDGKVRLVVVPIDYELGAEGKVGGAVKAGGDSIGADLGAKVEGALNFRYGDTWVFPTEDAADEWLSDVQWELARLEAGKTSPGIGFWNWATDWEPDIRDPDITEWEVGLDVAAQGTVGFGKLTSDSDGKREVKDAGTGVEIQGEAGDRVLVREDDSGSEEDGYPLTTYTFQVSGSYSYGAKIFGYGPGGERSYTGQTRVTYDKDGRLHSITWITTQETNDSEGYTNPGKVNAGGKDTDKQVSVTMTTVTFDDSNRNIGLQWLLDNHWMMPFQTFNNAFDENGALVSAEPGPDASPMDQLIYERGHVSRNVYEGDVDEYKVGADLALGFKFGFEGGYEGENREIVDSQYLGAPSNGERTFQDWPACEGG